MVSKNNVHLKQTKTADQTPHYGLRKLSVGVASVLLSTTLYLGATAQADTLPTGDELQSPAASAVADSSGSSAGTLTVAQHADSSADTQETTDPTDPTASHAGSTASNASQSSKSAVSASPVSESAVNSQNMPASSAASSADQTAEPAVSASPVSESAVNSQNMPASSAASNADQAAKPAVNTFSVSDLATTMFDLSPSATDLVTDSVLTTSLATRTAADTTANAETPDVSKWTYNVIPNGTANEIVLTGYTGTDSTIIVPNAVDFANAGVSINNGTVYLTYDLARKLATTRGATKLIVSNNGDAKVVACGKMDADNSIIGDANWSQVFQFSTFSSMDLRGLDTSQITNMRYMFSNCNNLTSLDVSNWDTSNVIDMDYMFYNCINLTSLDVSNWNTSNVISMNYTFEDCNNLTSLDLSNWDTSKVTEMESMFRDCTNLTSLDVSNWDTSNVNNMSDMFYNCSNLPSLDVSNWDTSNVTDMYDMFEECNNLTSLDLSNWDTSNVIEMGNMFYVDSYVPLEVITKDSKFLAYDYASDNRVSKIQFNANADDATLSSNNARTDSKTLAVAYTPEQAKSSTLTSKINQLAEDSTSNYQRLAKTYQATIKANPGLSTELAAAFDAVLNETATWPKYDLVAFNPTNVTLGQPATPTELLYGTYNAEWKKAAAKTTVEFVDDDNNGAVVGTPTVLSGDAGDADAVSMTLPANYKLVSGQTIPTSVTLSGANDTVQIHLKHQIQTIADNDPMNHTSFQVTVHYKKDGATNTFMPDTVITTKYKRTTTKDLVTGKYTATPFVLESISQTGTKIDGLGTPTEGVVKDVPAGWQYFTYSIPYNVSVPGWSQTHSGSSFTDAIGIAAGVSTAMKTAELTVIYTANTQNTHIKYVDANGTSVKTDTISGKTGTTQTVNSTVPTGWKMTTPQTIPTSVTFDDNGVPDTTIAIEHDHVVVSHDKPQTTGTQIPNGATTAKFKGVGQSDLNKTITRTVTITSPDGKAKTTTQTFTSTRDAVVDMVDGSVVYSDWTQGKWAAVDVPTYDHYTASQTSVPEQTVDGSTADSTVNVTYTANAETVTVQWVDDTENGKVVYSTNVSLQPGKTTSVWIFGLDDTGRASTDAVNLNSMYDLVGVSDSNVLKSWGKGYYDVFNLAMPNVDKWIDGNTYTVHLTHKIVKTGGYLSPTKVALRTTNSERYPNLMYTDDAAWSKTQKDVTRTITVVKPDGSQSTTTQKLFFSRQAQYDMVTGEFKGYTDWKEGTQTFAAYTPSAIAGYTAETAPTATATGDSDNSAITVHYTANSQTAKIIYVDKDGNTIKTDTVNGVTDQTVDTNSTVPTGWKLVDGQTVPATIKLGANTPDTKITVEHNHVSISHDNPQTNGTDIPNGTAKFKGVSDNDLNQTITRTITVNDPHQGAKTTTQTAKIYRDATVDMVDGSVTYGNWSTAPWPTYFVPAVDGYTQSQTMVEPKVVTNGTKDDNVTINYTANPQTAKIVYIDADGNTVKTDTVDGATDQTVNVNSTVPTGWKLVDGQTVPATIKLSANTPDTKITVEHNHVIVTNDNPQTDGTDIPNGAAKFKGVADKDLNQTITRTIQINDPYSGGNDVIQTAKISRSATVDMVDGSVVYGDWSTAQWNEYTVPDADGYTPSQKTIAAKPVVNGMQNETVTIDYTADDGTQTINYVDEDGNMIVKQTIHGKTDQNVAINDDKPSGWVLEEGQTVPTTVKIKAADEPMTIKIKHGIVTVTPDAPKTESDRMPDWTDKGYPAGVGYNDLNKTVTRTIMFELPDGQTKTVKQTTTFTRHATVDEVTDAVTYSDWNEQSHTFDAVDVPTFDGWTPSAEQIAEATVTPDSDDERVTVAYTANPKAPGSTNGTTETGKSADTVEQVEATVNTNSGSTNTVFNELTTIQGDVKADLQAKTSSHAKTAELPQTGNEQTDLQAIVGLALTGLAGMLGLGRKKRKNS